MLKRLLVLAAAVGSLAAPLSAQTTTFFASGGPVTFTPTTYGTNVIVNGVPVYTPFDLFADYLGIHRLIASTDGTLFTLDTRGSVAISSFGTLGSLTIASLSPGAAIFFTYVINGRSYSADNFYRERVGGYDLQYADYLAGENSNLFGFQLRGVASAATGLQCPGAITDPIVVNCSLLNPPVTSTPEPGTIALFATGLAGLIPVVIRRRRSASPS